MLSSIILNRQVSKIVMHQCLKCHKSLELSTIVKIFKNCRKISIITTSPYEDSTGPYGDPTGPYGDPTGSYGDPTEPHGPYMGTLPAGPCGISENTDTGILELHRHR